MKILEIDIHAEKTSENLLELARTASSQAHEFIIQDRSPSFFKIWRLLQFDPYKYFGIEDHGQICAVSGMVKTDFAQMPFASEVYMDTDLFANINKKSLRATAQLIETRFTDSLKSVYENGFLWGIEHKPRGLELCGHIAEKFKVEFYFPQTTCLTHIPLHEYFQQPETHRLGFQSLSTVEDNILSDLYRKYESSMDPALPKLPRLSREVLNQLKTSRSQSFVFQSDSCGGILSDFSEGRRYYTTGRNNLHLEKIKRIENWSDLTHKEIRILSLGMTWGNLTDSDIIEILSFAKRQKYHFLSARDQSQLRVLPLALNFERRIFFGHRKNLGNLKEWTHKHPIQIESFIA